jgi:hypothetical protein
MNSFTKELSPKVSDDSLNFDATLFEYVFSNLPIAEGAGIGELYRRGRLSIHVHFAFKSSNIDSHDFCALYRWLPFGIRREPGMPIPSHVDLPRMKAEFLGYYKEQPVFVDVVQLRQLPEDAALGIDSMVRLQSLNLCNGSSAYERSHLFGYDVLKHLRPEVDREGRFARSIVSSTIQNGELIDKVVERGSQVVNTVPDKSWEGLDRAGMA